MEPKNIVLNVNGIEVIYNHVILVLKGVSLQVPQGSIVAILGGNGAGKTTTLRAVSNLLKGERGEVTNYVAAFNDITQHKEAEEQIRLLAFSDPLTELPNRRLLLDRLEQAFAASARNRRHGALLLIDRKSVV